MSRTQFYAYKRRFQTHGLEGQWGGQSGTPRRDDFWDDQDDLDDEEDFPRRARA